MLQGLLRRWDRRAWALVAAGMIAGSCSGDGADSPGDGLAEAGSDALADAEAPDTSGADIGGDTSGPDTLEDSPGSDLPTGGCTADRLAWGLGGARMLPGTDCLECHRVGGAAHDSPLTLAGTVFVDDTCPEGIEGAEVHVTDGSDRSLTLVSNEVGNFYTDEPLEPPFRVSVGVDGVEAAMASPASNGSCGACHQWESPLGLVHGPR